MKPIEAPSTPEVEEAEYKRLLGLPHHHVLEEPLAGLAAWAREWYAEHGQPWSYARKIESLELAGETTVIDSKEFHSSLLTSRLQNAGATTAVVAAVGAGGEAEEEAGELWRAGHPDRYFFLEIYASAVVESLLKRLAGTLCAWADEQKLHALPPYSPGYQGWPLTDQHVLLELILGGGEALPSEVEILSSGQLRPKKTQLTLFGLAPASDQTTRITDLIPCTNCGYAPCRYRRAPFEPLEYDLGRARSTRPRAPAPGRDD